MVKNYNTSDGGTIVEMLAFMLFVFAIMVGVFVIYSVGDAIATNHIIRIQNGYF